MKFILREGSSVGKRLTDVFFFEVRQFLDNLRRRHAVGNEVDDVGHRDAKTAEGGSSGQDLRVLRDAIERVRHG